MQTFDFELYLSDDNIDSKYKTPTFYTDEFLDQIYNFFPDATFGVSNGKPYMFVSRESESQEQAIASAVADAKVLGWQILHIEIEP